MSESHSMKLRTGPDFALEEEADQILAEGRRGTTRLEDKKDYLTQDQLNLRVSREVFNHHGVPDASLLSGLFRREHNPLANQRPKKHKNEDME